MGEGRRRWRVADWGSRWRGRHRGHFQSPCGVVVRGGRRQSICPRTLVKKNNFSAPASKPGTMVANGPGTNTENSVVPGAITSTGVVVGRPPLSPAPTGTRFEPRTPIHPLQSRPPMAWSAANRRTQEPTADISADTETPAAEMIHGTVSGNAAGDQAAR